MAPSSNRIGKAGAVQATLAFIVAFIFVGAAFADRPVNFVTHIFPPFIVMGQENKISGNAYTVLDCVMGKLKLPYKVEALPLPRALAAAEAQEVDGVFPLSFVAERSKWGEQTGGIADHEWVWVLPAESKWDPKSPEFKAKASVGAFLGSAYVNFLEKNNYKVSLKPTTEDKLLSALSLGRIDAAFGGKLNLEEAMKTNNVDPTKFKIVAEQVNPLGVYLTRQFLKIHPDFIKRFNTNIAACRK